MQTSRGFSLIELMIAVTLGMLSVAAVGSVFIYGSRNYKQDDRISRMQDDLRFATAQLTQDIEMAGFWAQINDPVNNVNVHSSLDNNPEDCGPTTDGGTNAAGNTWIYSERRAGLVTLGDVSASTAAAQFACIDASEFVAGTDIIGIKRLAGSTATTFQAGAVYLRTNGVQTTLYRYGTTHPDPSGANVTVYEFQPSIWYIRNYSNTVGDGLPCLVRETLTREDPPQMFAECIASGIQDMQLEFGFDGNSDGVADSFIEYPSTLTTPPPANTLAQAVAVRVHLLARSTEPDPSTGYINEKTYVLGSKVVGPLNDRYYRRTLSSIVLMRNQSNRQTPFALPSS